MWPTLISIHHLVKIDCKAREDAIKLYTVKRRDVLKKLLQCCSTLLLAHDDLRRGLVVEITYDASPRAQKWIALLSALKLFRKLKFIFSSLRLFIINLLMRKK